MERTRNQKENKKHAFVLFTPNAVKIVDALQAILQESACFKPRILNSFQCLQAKIISQSPFLMKLVFVIDTFLEK